MEGRRRAQGRDIRAMKFALILVVIVVAYVAYEAVRIHPLLRASARLIESGKPFTRVKGESAMLILGDSTAVGVGAAAREDTVAGRIAALHPEWAVENYAVSGARIKDLKGQFAKAERDRYVLTVIHIGANDIIRFQSAPHAIADLEPALQLITSKSNKVIFLTAGNVGGAKFFPSILNPFYHRRTLQYHAAFEALAERVGVSYVNLYTSPEEDLFLKDSGRYFSADGLHPSSEGYRLWFERIMPIL